MLLILTSDKDLTADFLIVELIRRGLPYFRLNAEDLTRAGLMFALTGEEVRRQIYIGPRVLDLNDVEAVWYRRAIHPTPISALAPPERVFVSGELRHLATGLVLNPEIRWINPIEKVSLAEHKLYQLQLARKLGLRVPRTLVSRDPNELHSFAAGNAAGTICKPIFHGMFVDETSRYSIYTRRVTLDALIADDKDICPVLLQEEIPRIADVRATFIGSKTFVTDIIGDTSLVDWRDPDVSVQYFPSNLSDEVEGVCRAMLDRLGLIYGAFDFIKTADGEFIFLEVNPTGEWAWLEVQLGFPIRDAFIELFFNDAK